MIKVCELLVPVVDGVLYNESRSTLAAPRRSPLARYTVGRAFSRVSPALLPRFASLGQAAGRG